MSRGGAAGAPGNWLGLASSFFLSPGKFPSKLAGDGQALGPLSHIRSPGGQQQGTEPGLAWVAQNQAQRPDPSPILTRH